MKIETQRLLSPLLGRFVLPVFGKRVPDLECVILMFWKY